MTTNVVSDQVFEISLSQDELMTLFCAVSAFQMRYTIKEQADQVTSNDHVIIGNAGTLGEKIITCIQETQIQSQEQQNKQVDEFMKKYEDESVVYIKAFKDTLHK